MKKQFTRSIAIICFLFTGTFLQAGIKLPAILGDNMVLQQQSTVKLWGAASAKSKITVKASWNKKIYTATSDAEGKWLANIETPSAGGPYEISISDGTATVLKNIL
ncbi:MAG: sialate O-acetylesterase, partial [Candidatus Symbiothrix sp.]|nr:sialate O-acetylesterase [Candidatus Symbiothrix sp.]